MLYLPFLDNMTLITTATTLEANCSSDRISCPSCFSIEEGLMMVGVKRYIAMQLNRDVLVLIRCSIHSGSISVRFNSKIIAHKCTVLENMVYDWPMHLKIAWSTFN